MDAPFVSRKSNCDALFLLQIFDCNDHSRMFVVLTVMAFVVD